MTFNRSNETRLQMGEVENQDMKDYLVKLKKPKTCTFQSNHQQQLDHHWWSLVLISVDMYVARIINFQPYFITPSPSQTYGGVRSIEFSS